MYVRRVGNSFDVFMTTDVQNGIAHDVNIAGSKGKKKILGNSLKERGNNYEID